jgi:PAS domain S-box-containing protein
MHVQAPVRSWVRSWLPQGLVLPPGVWQRRHRTVLAVIFLHALFLAALGLWKGWGPWYALGEGAAIALLGGLAAWTVPGTRFRSAVAAFACVTCSAVLVQFSGGYIEAHFHYFIMVALIALYQDWLPFLVAVAFVGFDHGILGQLQPTWVYNHPAAIANPWLWAGVHATMVFGQCAALLVFWRGAERERARGEVILESAGEGLLGVNRDGTVQFANPASAAILGRRHDRLVGQAVEPMLGADAGSLPRLEGAQETLVVRPDGSTVPLSWAAKPAPQSDTGVAWVVSVHDISERKSQERRRLEELMEQDRFKTQLLNTASHELNTPISVIRLQLELLKEQIESPEAEVAHSLELLERNMDRLGTLVRQTLDVARIQSGRLRLDLAPARIDAIVADTCRSFEQVARAKGLTLEWTAEPGLLAEVDGPRLGQVFYNLVANAIKFTPAGGRVAVRAWGAAGAIRFEVADTGTGLAPADHEFLFKPFSQVPAGRVAGGAGLGLYISKNIIESHGGTIEARSDGSGRGATFSCEVPVVAPPATRAQATASALEMPISPAS